jgi:hypothetical protein
MITDGEDILTSLGGEPVLLERESKRIINGAGEFGHPFGKHMVQMVSTLEFGQPRDMGAASPYLLHDSWLSNLQSGLSSVQLCVSATP